MAYRTHQLHYAPCSLFPLLRVYPFVWDVLPSAFPKKSAETSGAVWKRQLTTVSTKNNHISNSSPNLFHYYTVGSMPTDQIRHRYLPACVSCVSVCMFVSVPFSLDLFLSTLFCLEMASLEKAQTLKREHLDSNGALTVHHLGTCLIFLFSASSSKRGWIALILQYLQGKCKSVSVPHSLNAHGKWDFFLLLLSLRNTSRG